VKGKSEPLNLHHALRVVALRGGQLRSTGLESPFVGRERELRLSRSCSTPARTNAGRI
jgi:hypothetical protein